MPRQTIKSEIPSETPWPHPLGALCSGAPRNRVMWAQATHRTPRFPHDLASFANWPNVQHEDSPPSKCRLTAAPRQHLLRGGGRQLQRHAPLQLPWHQGGDQMEQDHQIHPELTRPVRALRYPVHQSEYPTPRGQHGLPQVHGGAPVLLLVRLLRGPDRVWNIAPAVHPSLLAFASSGLRHCMGWSPRPISLHRKRGISSSLSSSFSSSLSSSSTSLSSSSFLPSSQTTSDYTGYKCH